MIYVTKAKVQLKIFAKLAKETGDTPFNIHVSEQRYQYNIS